jgi:hypothetical protein
MLDALAEIAREARSLGALAERILRESGRAETALKIVSGHEPQRLAAAAGRMRAVLRRRDELLPVELFGNPTYDMLLDLFIAHCEDRQVPVSELVGEERASGHRRIRALRQQGLVETRGPVDVLSEIVVGLTEEGAARMTQLVSETVGPMPALVRDPLRPQYGGRYPA